MKYACIDRMRSDYPVAVLCRVLDVSRSGYLQHLARQRRRQECPEGQRISNKALLVHIRSIHAASRQCYGWPRIWAQLRNQGVRVGKERVRRLMQRHGIVGRTRRRYKATTDSKHALPVAANLLARQFNPEHPNQVWAGDITCIATCLLYLYLASVIDLHSRRVIGWSMSERMTRRLVMDAMEMAIGQRRPDKQSGLIFHSDRGSQYCSADFQQMLQTHGIRSSMSRKGDCWDNACSEALFASLKKECLRRRRFATRRQAKDEIIGWLARYNSQRLHSTLGYISPVEYERRWMAAHEQAVMVYAD